MKNDNIMVSVIIPSYNVERYLSDACNSVFAQTYTDWEAIIINDGSVDTTDQIAKSYCEKDKRFRYIFQENKGLSATRKTGIDAANGQFIQFLDADDALLPDRLEKMVKASLKVEENVILYSDYWIGLNDSVTGKRSKSSRPIGMIKDIDFDDMYNKFAVNFIFIPACPLFRKSILVNVPYDTSLRSAEDWDLYLSLCNQDFKFRVYSEHLVVYRHSPSGLSVNYKNMLYYTSLVILKWKDKLTNRNDLYIKKIAVRYLDYWLKCFKINNKIQIQPILDIMTLTERRSLYKYFLFSTPKFIYTFIRIIFKKIIYRFK
ncbi:MAG: glycosyltransferase family 2 protein [Paludibacter sp.]